jgi:hypothetical protein
MIGGPGDLVLEVSHLYGVSVLVLWVYHKFINFIDLFQIRVKSVISYCLSTNVIYYFKTNIMHTIFMCKQHK